MNVMSILGGWWMFLDEQSNMYLAAGVCNLPQRFGPEMAYGSKVMMCEPGVGQGASPEKSGKANYYFSPSA